MSICIGCNKEMINGQVFNGLLKCHWDCQDKVREIIGNDAAEAISQRRINDRLRMEGIDPNHRLWKTLGGSV